MASGLKKVKKSLGPDALILSTRTVRKGRLGMLSRPILEITAAVDKPWQEKETTTPLRTPLYQPSPPNRNNIPYHGKGPGRNNEGTGNLYNSSQYSPQYTPEPHEDHLKREIGELRDIVMELSRKISTNTPSYSPIIPPQNTTEEHYAGIRPEHSIVKFLMNR